VNRQVNYIIYAILLSLSLPVGYYFVEKIVSTEMKHNQQAANEGLPESNAVTVKKNTYLGKNLFNSKCASCHHVFKNSVGPALMNLEERGPWAIRSMLYEWIKNPNAFMKKNKYTSDLKNTFGSMMQSFPEISNEEIDAIIDYINAETAQQQMTAP
jgi:mono/diheme cytochrome c family protein